MMDDKPYGISLWDTAGQEDYDRLRPLSYPQTDVFLACFSVSARTSFENIKSKWAPELSLYAQDAPILLVGTKCDLRSNDAMLSKLKSRGLSCVSPEEGRDLAEEIGAAEYMECSALTQEGVQSVFDHAVRCAISAKVSGSKQRKKCSIL